MSLKKIDLNKEFNILLTRLLIALFHSHVVIMFFSLHARHIAVWPVSIVDAKEHLNVIHSLACFYS